MRAWLVVILLTSLALAGCAGEAKDPTPSTTPETGGEDPDLPSHNATNLTLVLATSATNGTAPFAVNFTLSALNVTGAINWTLVDDIAGNATELANGTTLPVNVTHVFALVGNHAVTFEVNINGTVAMATKTITVTEGGPTLPTDLVSKATLQGTFTAAETDSTKSHIFEVMEGARAITIMGDWNGGIPLSDNWGYPNDIDIFLKAPSGVEAAKSEMLGFEFLHHEGDLAAGTWKLDLLGYDIVADLAYEFNILIWYTQPTIETAEDSALGDVDVLGTAPFSHTFEVPDHAQAVVTFLTWNSPAEALHCNSRNTRTNDLDLSVTFGGSEVFASSYFHSCEFNFIESGTSGAPLNKGGTWTVDVVAFMAPAADYKVQFIYA